jgi:hypothetical protein
MDVALGEEEVVGVRSTDVGDSGLVAIHHHRALETGDADGPVHLRK